HSIPLLTRMPVRQWPNQLLLVRDLHRFRLSTTRSPSSRLMDRCFVRGLPGENMPVFPITAIDVLGILRDLSAETSTLSGSALSGLRIGVASTCFAARQPLPS